MSPRAGDAERWRDRFCVTCKRLRRFARREGHGEWRCDICEMPATKGQKGELTHAEQHGPTEARRV